MSAAGPPPAGPRMRCYRLSCGKWAAALKSASGGLETLVGLFGSREEASAYVEGANRALEARAQALGMSAKSCPSSARVVNDFKMRSEWAAAV